jgi:hypothetical protein
VTAVLQRSAELDASIVGLFDALPGSQRDLDLVYLPGLDIAQHALLGNGDGAAHAASALAIRVDALRGYYAFLKQLLDPLLAPSERVDVLILTQPGRVDVPAAGVFASLHSVAGTVDVHPGVESRSAAQIADVAPTVLAGLGVPLSRELAGHALPLLLGGGGGYVDSYGPPFSPPASRGGRPLDQETIDRLRSLGYIK